MLSARVANVSTHAMDDENTIVDFQATLEKIFGLKPGAGKDLQLLRQKRDELRELADLALDEAMDFEMKRDAVLAAMESKVSAIKSLELAGQGEEAKALRAALRVDYTLGKDYDQKAGENMDRHFALMAEESDASSYFSVLVRLRRQKSERELH